MHLLWQRLNSDTTTSICAVLQSNLQVTNLIVSVWSKTSLSSEIEQV